MDCQKLSIDACMHAAQNERLPLRIVVQVLFSEQVKISNAIANSTLKEAAAAAAAASATADGHQFQPIISARKQLIEGTPQSFQEGWAAAKKDINTLKFELDTMKTKYAALQNEMDGLQRQFDKMTVATAVAGKAGKHGSTAAAAAASGWTSGWKKLSRLTKIGGMDGQEQMPAAGGAAEAAGARKGTRRWRNSIS